MPDLIEAPEENFVDDVVDESSNTQKETANAPATTPAVPAKEEEWKSALAQLTQNVNRIAQPKAPEPKQPTEDETAEAWGLWRPEKKDPEFLAKFLRLPADMDPQEKLAVIQGFAPIFDELRNGVARQGVIGAANILRKEFAEELKKMREEFAPIQETVSSTRQEKLRSDFESSYPELADPKYAPLLKLASSELNDKEFKDSPSYFKALAESAAEKLTAFTGSPFVLGAGTKQNKPAVTSPKLPRTSVGGTGGSGGGKGNTVHVSDDDSGTLDWMK